MNLTRDRVRTIGWAAVLTVCFALLLVLTFRVNAVKSEVRLTERQIIEAKREKLFLESEFLARASQQQLRNLNAVEFGYEAPKANQYIEGERQLVALSNERLPGAPSPVRVAAAADVVRDAPIVQMVSPISGKAMAAPVPKEGPRRETSAASLAERLSQVDDAGARNE